MGNKKALLILVGGRALPSMLTLRSERPDVVVAIVSRDEQGAFENLQKSISTFHSLSGYRPEVIVPYVVDAFQLENIRDKCTLAVQEHPDCDWTFNITSATKVMGIGAYEVAKDLASQDQSVRCWYLDTEHASVVPLVGQGRDSTIFKLNMDEYAAACNCRIGVKDQEFSDKEQQEYCQNNWVPFVQFLAKNLDYIDVLKSLVKMFTHCKPSKNNRRKCSILSPTEKVHILLEEAAKVHLIENLNWEKEAFFINDMQARFLEGSWLELYVWSEAQALKKFDYCGWNQKVLFGNREKEKDPDNELDVTLLYNARLIVVECKTDEKPFDAKYLSTLASAVRPLGDNAVTKILVTSSPELSQKEGNQKASYDKFKEKAQDKRIMIITREGLPTIGQTLAQQVNQPKYARI